jgi:uncharacterized protein
MSEEKKITFGRFVWHDMVSQDKEKAVEFYTALFGWELEDFDMGDRGVYTMWKADNQTMGGFGQAPSADVPAHWAGFVQVENIEETVARVEQNGGTLLHDIIDIPEVGKAVPFTDPAGGVVQAFQALKPFSVAPDYRPPELSVCWNELVSHDPVASQAFYTEVFGWKAVKEDMGGFEYTLFMVDEMQVAGLMQAPPEHKGPTVWLSHVYVDNLATTKEKAISLGATILMEPQTMPGIGSFFLLRDPFGAFIYAFEPEESKKVC